MNDFARRPYGVALISCLAILAVVIGAQFATQAQSPAPASGPAATVHIKDFAYSPATVTIKTGETVAFVNDDPVAHTVTSTDSKTFDSGNMDQHGKWQHTFKEAGTYTYLCTYHTYMKGTVVVKDAQ